MFWVICFDLVFVFCCCVSFYVLVPVLDVVCFVICVVLNSVACFRVF